MGSRLVAQLQQGRVLVVVVQAVEVEVAQVLLCIMTSG
jgi:hypothetical protein